MCRGVLHESLAELDSEIVKRRFLAKDLVPPFILQVGHLVMIEAASVTIIMGLRDQMVIRAVSKRLTLTTARYGPCKLNFICCSTLPADLNPIRISLPYCEELLDSSNKVRRY